MLAEASSNAATRKPTVNPSGLNISDWSYLRHTKYPVGVVTLFFDTAGACTILRRTWQHAASFHPG
jgi:hypothetical protein